ncbi:hypothetical protein GUITHDRAFT_140871 [Guillardia theta CCMP2712]|uniref:TIR domain-containing protein n=2 Tax=Guillardia theta TaxID=55529 RepID=L1J4G8_GUITC|nr:hypothetical protein GUITHDRAFT_140871 [Guillardia theta CCMP2712]EKX43024.1 hypothetical protein GUITHDRAFT_140871 [Guillardia theta CCMP2712]|eukprot:XP_005830004.1 hypothetical protein GUITHDRAFT_140871 [Guillardia theta CCMP2712]
MHSETGDFIATAHTNSISSRLLGNSSRSYNPVRPFSLKGRLFHVFLSYRVATEKDAVKLIYKQLREVSTSRLPIPAEGRGQWCGFTKKPSGLPPQCAKVFLDVECLEDGKNWEDSFARGVVHTMVFVPLLSWTGDGGGSLGGMMSLKDADRVDNVLLEYIIALEWTRMEDSSLRSILPVFMDRDSEGAEVRFPMEELKNLPDRPSKMTNDTAEQLLRSFGVKEAQLMEMRSRSVKETVGMILKLQGIKLSQMSSEQPFTDCAERILHVVRRDIDSWRRRRFRFNTPTGVELLDWLQENSLMRAAPILNAADLHTLDIIAKLRREDVDRLWTLFSIATGVENGTELETLGLRLRLAAAIEKLKEDERSHKLARRLDDYTDVRGSALSCTFSSNACEIAMSKVFFQVAVALYGSGLILFGAYVMANPFLWYGGGRTRLLWANYFIMAPLNEIGLGILIVYIAYVGRYKSPLIARRFAQRMFMVNSFTAVLALLVEILQHALSLHDPSWTWGTPASYAVNPILNGGANKYVGDLMLVIACSYFAMIPILLVLWVRVRKEASQYLSRDVERYNERWKRVRERFNIESLSVASEPAPHRGKVADVQVVVDSSRCEDDREAFRRVLVLTRRISSIITNDSRALSRQDKWTNIVWLLTSHFDQSRRYSLNGKARQRSSDIDQLFAQAASINEPVQQVLSSIVESYLATQTHEKEQPTSVPSPAELHATFGEEEPVKKFEFVPGPVKQPLRSFQKCIRAYRRDVGLLTDLVRCTFVVEDMQTLLGVLMSLLERSVVGFFTQHDLYGEGGEGGGEGQGKKLFRITKVKNRFDEESKDFEEATGFRNLSLSLEVGWTSDERTCHFVPVAAWERNGEVETHIVEVQVHLRPLYEVTKEGSHGSYVFWRDLLAK